MRLIEYRIPLPFTVDEFQRAQIYSVSEGSMRETGGGAGVRVIKNEPFTDQPQKGTRFSSGQYTHKIYNLEQKLSPFWRRMFHPDALKTDEYSWNAFPYTRTNVSNTPYFGDKFAVCIESMHVGDDRGEMDNVFELDAEDLKKRKIVRLNVASNENLDKKDDFADASTNTDGWVSKCTGRGPLTPVATWATTVQPVMCVYKLVRIKFKKLGLQTIVEGRMEALYPRLFTRVHRQMIVWMDNWYPMTLEDCRKFEKESEEKLAEQIKTGKVRGVSDQSE